MKPESIGTGVVPTQTLGEHLRTRGLTRRSLLQYAACTASLMGLSPREAAAMAQGLEKATRQSVIWLSFQECTGCTESLTRSFSPSLEDLIFDFISLDYHHTLQAVSGEAAEAARHAAMKAHAGRYIVVVDGSVPLGEGGIYSVIAGMTNAAMLAETVEHAAAVIAVGTCAAHGGLPEARPNPTGAVAISQLVKGRTVVNIPGCPPMPQAMAGTLTHFLSFGTLPELDKLGRPKAFFGETIHDRCYRRPFYERGQFAETFDDEGAKQGWCLFKVGCKGPVTYNACATIKWNGGAGWPVEGGHGCLGCSEPGFWDWGGFYKPLSQGQWGGWKTLGAAAAAGAAIGLASVAISRSRQARAREEGKV